MIRSGASRRSASASTAITGPPGVAQPADFGVDGSLGAVVIERR